jgi:hypothetical protein
MPSGDEQDIHGGCYCGGVRFRIAGGTKPHWAGYCHCRDCRQAHAAPIYQYVYVKEPFFEITQGEGLLKWFTRVESRRDVFRRHFCDRCGSKVYNSLIVEEGGNSVSLRGTFPSLFDDQSVAKSEVWSPREHVYCAESIMDVSVIEDGIPRFQGNS